MTPLKISQVLAAGRDGAAAWEDPVPPGAPGVDLPKEGVGAPPRRQRARDRWVEAMSTIRAASSAQGAAAALGLDLALASAVWGDGPDAELVLRQRIM
ncbi:unnamed protein product [Prorocentrum cordatum]|uniref:Uncharacterized protein n=1 Tax=Prorocentrum cordatum TaxID=2364126 RepID=A0ABN9SCA4_9DINO|nr:unnamed protein product [Polarella glacialis]